MMFHIFLINKSPCRDNVFLSITAQIYRNRPPRPAYANPNVARLEPPRVFRHGRFSRDRRYPPAGGQGTAKKSANNQTVSSLIRWSILEI
jgi:hypothetical protein